MTRQHTVSFNLDEKRLHELAMKEGITSESFSKFAKTAFYERLDKLKAERNNGNNQGSQ